MEYERYSKYVAKEIDAGDVLYTRYVQVFDNQWFRGRVIREGKDTITKEQYEQKLPNNKPKSLRKAVIDKKEFLEGLSITQQRVLSVLINKPANKTIIEWYFSDGYLSVLEKEHIFAILDIELAEDPTIEDLVNAVKVRLEGLNYV